MRRIIQAHICELPIDELAAVAGGFGVMAGGTVVSPGGIVTGGAAVINGVAVAYGYIDRPYYAGFGFWGRQHVSGYSIAG